MLSFIVLVASLALSQSSSVCNEELPEVDLNSPDAAKELASAFQSWGFAYIRGHDMSSCIVEEAEKHAKHFFNMPPRVKRHAKAQFPQQFTKTTRGWSPFGSESLNVFGKTPDLKEVLDVGFTNATSKNKTRNKREYLGENLWPENSNNLQTAIKAFSEVAADGAHRVLKLLAKGVDAEGAFDDAFDEDALQVQRLTKYPASDGIEDKTEGEIGAGVHTDFGGITVLHADGPGLEILLPNRSSELVIFQCFLVFN